MKQNFTDLINRLHKLEKLFESQEKSQIKRSFKLRLNKKKMASLEEEIKKLKDQVRNSKLNKSLSTLFCEDQIALLQKEYKKIPKWCNKTLIRAYKLRFVCGTSGYEEILRQGYPLPSVRTLTRKLENFNFSVGRPIEDIFEFLKIKVDNFKDDSYKDGMIVLDEMSITPGKFYDPSFDSFIGNVTLPGHDHNQIATKALVFMVAGLSARWKQVVRYDFTSDSVDGKVFKLIIDEIIYKCEDIGIRIHVVTSDMSSANQAMWLEYKIYVLKQKQINNSCEHPYDKIRRLYFYADGPHAFKNARTSFLNNESVRINEKFAHNKGLPGNVAKSKHYKDVVEEDKNNELKLAPKLREDNLNTKNHFQKMRVGNAKRLFSESVGSALEFLASDNPCDERLTTAYFTDILARWFYIMCGRSIDVALSYLNIDKYNEIINFLNDFIIFIETLKVGAGQWKPFQTAMLISTKTVIDLSFYLLNNGFKFFFSFSFNSRLP